jgi:Tol biopolymer transport system component
MRSTSGKAAFLTGCLCLGAAGAWASEIAVPAKGHAFNPAWSMDGKWIAFEINDYEGTNDLYMVEIMGTTPQGIPQRVAIPGTKSSFGGGGAMAAAPNWHPEGALIFEGSNAGGTNRLYLVMPGRQGAGELISSTLVRGDLSWPTITPDGESVMFVSDITGGGDLYVWDKASNTVTQKLASPFSEMAPRFDLQGTRIAYSRKNRGGQDVFTLEGTSPRPRVGGSGDQSRPEWSGSDIVFFSNERGEDKWDVVISSGVGQKRVIAGNIRLPLRATPAVTPDKGWVVYGSSDPTKSRNIFCTALDGTGEVAIDTGMVAAGEPSMAYVNGRWMLAFTALPAEGSDWRKLHVIDITSWFE